LRDYRDPVTVDLEARAAAKATRRVQKDIDAPTVPVPEKSRHSWLVQQAGRLRREYGLGFDALYAGLLDLVQHCESSLDKTDDELRSIAKYCSEQPTPFRFSAMTEKVIRIAPRAVAWKEGEIRQTLVQVCGIGELLTIRTILGRITPILQYTPTNGTLYRAMNSAKFEKASKSVNDGRKTLWIRRGELKGKDLGHSLG
jgi:hypothetical protein